MRVKKTDFEPGKAKTLLLEEFLVELVYRQKWFFILNIKCKFFVRFRLNYIFFQSAILKLITKSVDNYFNNRLITIFSI